MPSGNLLGLGKKPRKGFEQEEVTGNSFSSLLVEEAFSFLQERAFWKIPLLKLKRKELFFPYPHPSNKAMKQLVTIQARRGVNGEEFHEKVKCRAEMLRAEKILQFKGLSMGKEREIHGPRLGQEGGKNKQERLIFTKAHFLRRGGLLCFLLL